MFQNETMLQAFGLGVPELLIILVIVLLIFGAGKLPQIGDALGKSIRNFKKSASTKEKDAVDVTPKSLESQEPEPQTVEVETNATEEANA